MKNLFYLLAITSCYLFGCSSINNKIEIPKELTEIKCAEFPKIMKVPVPVTITDPTVSLAVSNEILYKLIVDLFNSEISFPISGDETNSMSDHYIQLNNIDQLTFHENNVIGITARGGIYFRLKNGLRPKISINRLDLVLTPLLLKVNKEWYLYFTTQVKFLDVKKTPETVDKCIANYLATKGIFNFDTISLSNFFPFKIENPVDHSNDVAPKIEDANFISDDKGFNLLLKIK